MARSINDELPQAEHDTDDDSVSAHDDPRCVVIHGVRALAQSEKALLCRIPGLDRNQWVPQSVIHDDSEVYAYGHYGRLVVQAWIAEKLGITYKPKKTVVAPAVVLGESHQVGQQSGPDSMPPVFLIYDDGKEALMGQFLVGLQVEVRNAARNAVVKSCEDRVML